jgi:hypothetical protein
MHQLFAINTSTHISHYIPSKYNSPQDDQSNHDYYFFALIQIEIIIDY